MAVKALRVCVLSDGQPGHYNQSSGVVQALGQHHDVEVCWITLRMRLGLWRRMLRCYLNHSSKAAPPSLLRLFYHMEAIPEQAFDLVVSSGGKTSFANVWLARSLGAKNIFAGSLRGLSADLFSVVLTMEPIEGAASNLVLQLPPSAINFAEVESAGARLRDCLGHDGRYWTLLLGGNGAGFWYRQRDWMTLARLMNRFSKEHGIRWLVASSRRTGKIAERMLKRYIDRDAIALQCWYADSDDYQAEQYLGAAERVFVTEDSMTMVTEAIYSRRPVYSLRPRHAMPNNRYEQALRRFSDQGLLCRYALEALVQGESGVEKKQCRVLTQSPLQELGGQLVQRLRLS